MYSKVVYDYFDENPKKFKIKPNKLTRTNAFKRKATKKAVVVPTKSNTSIEIQRSSSPIENASRDIAQTTESRSTVNVVYDTVQCIWKYAKSFISNQNSDSSRFPECTRKKIKYRTSSRNNNLKTTNEKVSAEHFPQEIADGTMKEETQQDEKIGEDSFPETSTNLLELNEHSTIEVNSEDPERLSVEKELDLNLLDLTNNEKLTSTNCDDITSCENIKPLDEDTSCKISIKRNQSKNKLADLQNNNHEAESKSCLDVIEVQILKSSMKTYGRGKRRNKKLHVHFKEDQDNEKPKHSSLTSKNLRKSDCYHPNAFFKQQKSKRTPEKKKSVNSRGKKRRLALCTKSNRSSFKKKRTKRNSSTSISLQSKSSDCFENKAGKRTRKTPKKYSVYATTKVYKKKRGRNCKKAKTNNKGVKTPQGRKKSA